VDRLRDDGCWGVLADCCCEEEGDFDRRAGMGAEEDEWGGICVLTILSTLLEGDPVMETLLESREGLRYVQETDGVFVR